MSPPPPAIEVVLPPKTYCSGSYVEGEVHLNFRNLQQDRFETIWVALTGRAQAAVDEEKRKSITLVDLSRVLWTHGAEYPPPDTDILRLFFRFRLPDDLPPSFYHHTYRTLTTCAVLYSLTTVGARPGCSDVHKIHNPIVVLPRVDLGPLRALSSSKLEWKAVHAEKNVWKGLRGNEGTVRVEFSLPDISTFPLFTPIPYKVDIMTETIPTRGCSRDGPGKTTTRVFPWPPTDPSELTLELIRRTNVFVGSRISETTLESTVAHFLGAGIRPHERVNMSAPEREWVVTRAADAQTKTKEKGVWVQRAQFWSHVLLSVPPTFKLEDGDRLRMACEYVLKLHVPFEGYGNNVKVEMPITVVSGIDEPVQHTRHRPVQRKWDPPEAYHHLYPQGSAAIMAEREVVLPSAYWEVHTDAEWKAFGRSIKAPGRMAHA